MDYQNHFDEKEIISGDAYRETFGTDVPTARSPSPGRG
jgi:hypothetical protein